MPSHDNIRTTEDLISEGCKPRTVKARSPYVSALLQQTPAPANDVLPRAFIEDGPELDKALRSLGLERVPVRAPVRVPQNTLGEVIIFTALYVGLIAALSGAVWFALQMLAAFAPGGAQ